MSGLFLSSDCSKSWGPEGRSLIGGTLLRELCTVVIYQLVEKNFNILTNLQPYQYLGTEYEARVEPSHGSSEGKKPFCACFGFFGFSHFSNIQQRLIGLPSTEEEKTSVSFSALS